MLAMQLRKVALKCADRLGVYHLLQRRRHGALALGYHGVEERILDERIQGPHMPLEIFEQHIDYIARHFEVLSLDELANRLQEGRGLDGRQVVLTFDDGYLNNLHTVAPVLRSHGLSFAVFVCPDRIEAARRFVTYTLRASIYFTERTNLRVAGLDREFELTNDAARHHAVVELSSFLKSSRQETVEAVEADLLELHSPERWAEINDRFRSDALMSWEELKSLQEQGVIVGSHGCDHCILHDRQDASRIQGEIRRSREDLIQRLGRCDYFAYPNGRAQDISARAVAQVDAAGYRLGFSLIFGEIRSDSPRNLLPRVDADEDLDTLKFYLHAAYSPRTAEEGLDRAVTG